MNAFTLFNNCLNDLLTVHVGVWHMTDSVVTR